jgi:hypothetical protein
MRPSERPNSSELARQSEIVHVQMETMSFSKKVLTDNAHESMSGYNLEQLTEVKMERNLLLV